MDISLFIFLLSNGPFIPIFFLASKLVSSIWWNNGTFVEAWIGCFGTPYKFHWWFFIECILSASNNPNRLSRCGCRGHLLFASPASIILLAVVPNFHIEIQLLSHFGLPSWVTFHLQAWDLGLNQWSHGIYLATVTVPGVGLCPKLI